MKISRNTPDQLILDHIPWQSAIFSGLGICFVVFLGISYFPDEIFIGSVILAVGLAIGLFQFGLIVQRVQVIFDRAGGSVKIRQRGLFSYTQVTHDLSDVVEAIVEEEKGNKGQTLARSSLVLRGMSEGIHPMVEHFDGTYVRAHHDIVGVVNRWLGAGKTESAQR